MKWSVEDCPKCSLSLPCAFAYTYHRCTLRSCHQKLGLGKGPQGLGHHLGRSLCLCQSVFKTAAQRHRLKRTAALFYWHGLIQARGGSLADLPTSGIHLYKTQDKHPCLSCSLSTQNEIIHPGESITAHEHFRTVNWLNPGQHYKMYKNLTPDMMTNVKVFCPGMFSHPAICTKYGCNKTKWCDIKHLVWKALKRRQLENQ